MASHDGGVRRFEFLVLWDELRPFGTGEKKAEEHATGYLNLGIDVRGLLSMGKIRKESSQCGIL